jgi:hypothetical protein
MIKLAALLILSIVLITSWFVTAVTLPVTPASYLNLTAPWWHMLLHVGWVAAVQATGVIGVYRYWDWRSAKRRELSQQPPQHA